MDNFLFTFCVQKKITVKKQTKLFSSFNNVIDAIIEDSRSHVIQYCKEKPTKELNQIVEITMKNKVTITFLYCVLGNYKW